LLFLVKKEINLVDQVSYIHKNPINSYARNY